MKENYPNFNWGAYFKTVFSATNVTVDDDERVILVQPDYFQAMESMEASAEVKGRDLSKNQTSLLSLLTFQPTIYTGEVLCYCPVT